MKDGHHKIILVLSMQVHASYSPSLMNIQYNILEDDFNIKPEILLFILTRLTLEMSFVDIKI